MKLPDTVVIFWTKRRKVRLFFENHTTAQKPQKRPFTYICLAYKNTHLEHPQHAQCIVHRRQLLLTANIFESGPMPTP